MASPLRRLVPRTRATVALRRSATVQPAARFLLREVAGRPGRPARYRARRTGAVVHIRHRTFDLEVLHEIHISGGYRPPDEVAAALSRVQGPLRIADLGGHTGMFGAWALKHFPGSSVVSFEPDEQNLPLLTATVAANGAGGRWEVIPAAAGVEAGSARFDSGQGAFSKLTDGGDGVSVEVRDALPVLARCHLAKIDIEGGEWPILRDARLAGSELRAVVLEFHPLPGGDSAAEVVRLLEAAGFTARVEALFPVPGLGLAWGWR